MCTRSLPLKIKDIENKKETMIQRLQARTYKLQKFCQYFLKIKDDNKGFIV